MSSGDNENISIIRVCSSLNNFELADSINTYFDFDLRRCPDFPYKERKYTCFFFHCSLNRITLFLISNKTEKEDEVLITALPNTDYLFAVIGRDHAKISNNILKSLTKYEVKKSSRQKISPNILNAITNIKGINVLHTDLLHVPTTLKNYLTCNIIEHQFFIQDIVRKAEMQ